MKPIGLLSGVILVVIMLALSSSPAMAQRGVSVESDSGYAGQVVVVRIGAGTITGWQIYLFVSENGLANGINSTTLNNGLGSQVDPRFDAYAVVTLPADLETGFYYIKVFDGSFYVSNRIWVVNLYN